MAAVPASGHLGQKYVTAFDFKADFLDNELQRTVVNWGTGKIIDQFLIMLCVSMVFLARSLGMLHRDVQGARSGLYVS